MLLCGWLHLGIRGRRRKHKEFMPASRLLQFVAEPGHKVLLDTEWQRRGWLHLKGPPTA